MARKCIVCGTSYKYCSGCAADKFKPTWMAVFDKESCRTIMNTLTSWRQMSISTNEAYDILKDFIDADVNSNIKKDLDDLKREYAALTVVEEKKETDSYNDVRFNYRKKNKKANDIEEN